MVAVSIMLAAYAQPTTVTTQTPENEGDYLKRQLQELSGKYAELQQQVKSVDSKVDKTDVLVSITARQTEAVRLSGSFVERFAQGSQATETILTALSTGAKMGSLSSPFTSATFTKEYDNWINKWGKFIPAIALPALSLTLENTKPNTKLASVPIGISLTALLSAINFSKKDKVQEGLSNLQSTMDLFDLNRLVYNDMQKLQSYIRSANKADSLLSKDFATFWASNKDLFLKSDEDLRGDKRYKDYINNAQIYMSRFQLRLVKIKFVLDESESMIRSYSQRDYIKNYDPNKATKINQETKDAVDKLTLTYNAFRRQWEELQGRYYQISPEELRKLDSYYDLENLKLQATAITPKK